MPHLAVAVHTKLCFNLKVVFFLGICLPVKPDSFKGKKKREEIHDPYLKQGFFYNATLVFICIINTENEGGCVLSSKII